MYNIIISKLVINLVKVNTISLFYNKNLSQLSFHQLKLNFSLEKIINKLIFLKSYPKVKYLCPSLITSRNSQSEMCINKSQICILSCESHAYAC